MLPRTLLLDVWKGHLSVTVWKLYIVPVVLVYVVSLAYLFECFLSFLLKFSWLIQTISILKGGVSVPGASKGEVRQNIFIGSKLLFDPN